MHSLLFAGSLMALSGSFIFSNGPTPEEFYESGLEKLEAQQYDDAIVLFTKALKLDTAFAPAYYKRGTSFFMKNDFKAALHDYDRYLLIDYTDANGFYDRAMCLVKLD